MDNQTLVEIYENISTLNFKNLIYFTPALATVIEVITWVTFGSSSLVFIILIFLVVKKSPKEMKVYKWYICCNTLPIYMFEMLVNGLVHPINLFPSSTPAVINPSRMFDGEVYQVNLAHIILGIFIIWYYTLALMFLYRYAQTTRNLKLSRFLGSLWSIAVHIFILGIILTFLIFYGGYLFRKSKDSFLEAMINYTMEHKGLSMEELYEMLYTNYNAYMLVGYLPLSTIIIFNAVNLFGGALIFFSTYKIWSLLHKYRPNFSPRTFKLYKIFTFALIIEIINASLLVILPVDAMLICNYYCPNYIILISGILFMVTGFFPLVSQICLMCYITPYRKALIAFGVKLGKYFRRQNHANAITNRVTTIQI